MTYFPWGIPVGIMPNRISYLYNLFMGFSGYTLAAILEDFNRCYCGI